MKLFLAALLVSAVVAPAHGQDREIARDPPKSVAITCAGFYTWRTDAEQKAGRPAEEYQAWASVWLDRALALDDREDEAVRKDVSAVVNYTTYKHRNADDPIKAATKEAFACPQYQSRPAGPQ
jgi:hypothetical protein